jgi:hypothetical protein
MLDNIRKGFQHIIASCEDGLLQWTEGMKKEEEGASYIAIMLVVKSLVGI